jgi:hypothetical protein
MISIIVYIYRNEIEKKILVGNADSWGEPEKNLRKASRIFWWWKSETL